MYVNIKLYIVTRLAAAARFINVFVNITLQIVTSGVAFIVNMCMLTNFFYILRYATSGDALLICVC